MPGLVNPAGMLLAYNSFSFPVSMEPPKIGVAPIYDEAGRTVVACRYTISLTAVIYPEQGEDTAAEQMHDLRMLLSEPAAELRIEGTGFSDLVVNRQGGRIWDADWGPKPQVTECVQLGDQLAWRVGWQCVTVVPEECPEEAEPGLGRLYEWNYSVRWAIDQHGLTSRTVSGHVVVPITRRSVLSRELADHADRARELVKNVAVPEGFRRIPGDATLSKDRRRLEFSLTDVQLASPYAPPPGVILCSGRHDTSTMGTANFSQQQCVISASYTVGRGVRKSEALRPFLELVYDRWAHIKRNSKSFYIPLAFSASEELWSQTTSYSIRFMSTSAAPKGVDPRLARQTAMFQVANAAGLWVRPVRTTWGEWSKSLIAGAWSPRGYAGLGYDRDDDDFVSVCIRPPDGSMLKNDPGKKQRPAPDRGAPGDSQVFEARAPEFFPDPDLTPDASWLEFDMSLELREVDDVAVHKLLPAREVQYDPQAKPLSSTAPWRSDYRAKADPPHAFQFRAEPTIVAVLKGRAVRAAYTVGKPVLISAGGQKAYPVRQEGRDYFETKLLGNYLTPFVLARWHMTYVLEGVPRKGILPPEHAIHGALTDDDGLAGFTALRQ